MTVYGYLRVSTDKQDCDNQKILLLTELFLNYL